MTEKRRSAAQRRATPRNAAQRPLLLKIHGQNQPSQDDIVEVEMRSRGEGGCKPGRFHIVQQQKILSEAWALANL